MYRAGLGPVSSWPGPVRISLRAPSREAYSGSGCGDLCRHPQGAEGLGSCVLPADPWPGSHPPPGMPGPRGAPCRPSLSLACSPNFSLRHPLTVPASRRWGLCVAPPESPVSQRGSTELKRSTQTHGAGPTPGHSGNSTLNPFMGGGADGKLQATTSGFFKAHSLEQIVCKTLLPINYSGPWSHLTCASSLAAHLGAGSSSDGAPPCSEPWPANT